MKWFVILLCVLFVCLGCSEPKEAPPTKKVPEVLVDTAVATPKDIPLAVNAPGVVEPLRTVTLLSQVTGTLQKIEFQEGQDVEEGDILFILDKAPFAAKVKEAEANLAKDRANLVFLEAEARRCAAIAGAGASRSDVEKTRAEALATEAIIRSHAAVLEQARLNLSYCTIRAPFSGRTGLYLAHEGALIEANETPLVVINQISPIHVGFSVPEKRLPSLQACLKQQPLKVAVSPATDRNVRYEGRLVFLDNAVDKTTGMLFLKGEFENMDRTLWPGQYVEASLILRMEEDALTVPQGAVMPGQKGPYVFVVKKDMTVESRQVKVDRSVRTDAVITSGLTPGETVVVAGQNKLQTGFRVKTAQAMPASAGSSPPGR